MFMVGNIAQEPNPTLGGEKPALLAVMLIPLCGRSIPAVCRWFRTTKNNCGDPSPRQVGAQDDARLQIAISGSKRILFLNDRSWNVIENKGSLWKTLGRSRNVYENTGTYPVEAGMLEKIKGLIS